MLQGAAGIGYPLEPEEPLGSNNPFITAFEESKAGTQTIRKTERWMVPAPSGMGAVPAYDRQFASTYGGTTLEPGWDRPIRGRDAPSPHWAWPEYKKEKQKLAYELQFLGPSNQQEAVRMHWNLRASAPPPRCDYIPRVVEIAGSDQINF
jgi:hypothetical protein